MKKSMYRLIFIAIFSLTIAYPIYGSFLSENIELSGVSVNSNYPKFSVKTFFSGEFQSSVTDWWADYFPGKNVIIKVRNQLLFSLTKQSPNNNVVIGKNYNLYEPVYINREIGVLGSTPKSEFENLIQKLGKLQRLLEENGKELYIFITPSKAQFVDEFPWQYDALKVDDFETDYNKFIKMLPESDLKYFDAVACIDELSKKNVVKAPLFYKAGTHWSHSYGSLAAIDFAEYISENSKWDLSKLEFKESECDAPIWPDADLYQSLNVISTPKEQYYQVDVKIREDGEEKDKPSVFLRGGSFMGQSLKALVAAGVFDEDVHLENNYYFTNRYQQTGTLSNAQAYDEMDINALLAKSDIVILEVNVAGIANMSFGFIDYLLEHPEYLNNFTND